MYKLLLADDEPAVAQFVEYVIDGFSLPVKLVAAAENGEEAMKLIREHSPHIVLLDIEMTRFNGLEVGKFTALNFPKTKIIMMTAYDYFDYAKQSIRINVLDYLLKPVPPEQLSAVIKKALNALTKEKLREERRQRDLRELERLKPSLVEKAINSLVARGRTEIPGMRKLKFSEATKFSFLGSLALWQKGTGLPPKKEELGVLAKRLNTGLAQGLFVVPDFGDHLIFTSRRRSWQVNELEQLSRVPESLEKAFVLADIRNYPSVPEAYSAVREEAERKAFWSSPGVVFLKAPGNPALKLEELRNIGNSLMKTFYSGDRLSVHKETHKLLTLILQELSLKQPSANRTRTYLFGLITGIFNTIAEKENGSEQVEEIAVATVARLTEAKSWEEISAVMHQFNDALLNELLPTPNSCAKT